MADRLRGAGLAVQAGASGLVGTVLTPRVFFVALAFLASGCETAAIILGGAGSGLSGGPNQGLAAVQRKKDREAAAANMNAQRCVYLMNANAQEQQLLIERHQMERQALKDEVDLAVVTAPSNEARAAAYETYARKLEDLRVQFQAQHDQLNAKARETEEQCR